MKKMTFFVALALCITTTAFAADKPAAPITPAELVPTVGTTGTIKSINVSAKSVVVTQDDKKDTTVPNVSLVSDKAGLPIGIEKLAVGQKVRLIPLAKASSEIRLVE